MTKWIFTSVTVLLASAGLSLAEKPGVATTADPEGAGLASAASAGPANENEALRERIRQLEKDLAAARREHPVALQDVPGAPKAGPGAAPPVKPVDSNLTSSPACLHGCDWCGNGHGHCEAGLGLYYIKPYWSDNNRAYTATTNAGTSAAHDTVGHFDYDFDVAPRLWLEYLNTSGNGIRIGYWHFFERSSPTELVNYPFSNTQIRSEAPLGITPPAGNSILGFPNANNFLGGPGISSPGWVLSEPFPLGADHLVFDSTLRLDVIDLEALRETQAAGGSVLYSVGARAARLTQTYNANRFNTGSLSFFGVFIGAFDDTALLDSSREFTGGGPTAFAEFRRAIGSGFTLYGSGRGSLLIGEDEQKASVLSIVSGTTGLGGGRVNSSTTADLSHNRVRVLPVIELDAGGEWVADVRRARLFAQLGVNFQSWLNAGTASSDRGALFLFGASGAVGVRY